MNPVPASDQAQLCPAAHAEEDSFDDSYACLGYEAAYPQSYEGADGAVWAASDSDS